ncbi:MAG TPA: PRC-barrel domain-containing protein [Chthonomonadaceae bacterium]|nr:PRC-barrel domain-containing protein [Chthonomonadaceae bacterium]
MQVELGARVRSSDNQDIGTIKHLILDPNNGRVKAIVVERGVLLPEDTEIPVEDIQSADSSGVHVSYTAAQTRDLPRFDRSLYTEAPGEQTHLYPGWPAGGILWPSYYPAMTYGPGLYPSAIPVEVKDADAPQSREEAQILEQVERSNAVIEAGDDVISLDGQKLGQVHNVIFDPQTGQPITLVIRKGLVFTDHVELPAQAIASVEDGVVRLNLTKVQVEAAKREPGVPVF